MTENINNNVDFLRIKDGKMKESLERLLIIREEIILTEEKIKFQDEEMIKTQKLIDDYKQYYGTQKGALEHFCNERDRLNVENRKLLEVVNALQKDDNQNNTSLNHNVGDPKLEALNIKNLISSDVDVWIECNTNKGPNISNGVVKPMKMETIENITPAVDNMQGKIEMTPKKALPKKRKKKVIAETIDKLKKAFKEGHKTKKKAKLESKVNVAKTTTSSDVNVTLKVPSTPLRQLFSIEPIYSIHKLCVIGDDVFLCGNRGLLMKSSSDGTTITWYRGHQDFYVYNFYVHNGSIISIAFDYILNHKLTTGDHHRLISTFPAPIRCTCLYKNTLYGSLEDGVMFIVDLTQGRVRFCGRILPPLSKSMSVVKLNDSLHLIVGLLNGEIVRYDLNDSEPRQQDIGKVDGLLKGVLNNGNTMICFTDKCLYYIDKGTWSLTKIRETSNVILSVDIATNRVIMVDNCNILHRYNLKKGRITVGSTIESLPMTGKISALHMNETEKKIVVACQADVCSMKL